MSLDHNLYIMPSIFVINTCASSSCEEDTGGVLFPRQIISFGNDFPVSIRVTLG